MVLSAIILRYDVTQFYDNDSRNDKLFEENGIAS